jgi:hypothetical protein
MVDAVRKSDEGSSEPVYIVIVLVLYGVLFWALWEVATYSLGM